jgi:hypothetical protein
MKPSFLTGVAVGYVLGARAGRERYFQLVALGRRFAGSPPVQHTADALQAQAGLLAVRTKDRLLTSLPLPGRHAEPAVTNGGVNGHRQP